MTTGRDRDADQARQLSIEGGGTSNGFLHGDLQMAADTPADTSEPITGTASLFDKNDAQTGNILVLDLEGEPGVAPDGRTIELAWTVGDDSSGTFSGAEGEGTVTIRDLPGGRRTPGVLGAGRALVGFQGRVEVDGTTNSLRIR